MKIILTITSCKRLNLFEKTIQSFCLKFQNINMINKVLLFDDSSNPQERIKMFEILQENFKNVEISFILFEKESFKQNRHREIIKIWHDQIKKYDFCFHLEDDWECVERFDIEEDLLFLKKNKNVIGINYTWDKFKFFPIEFQNLIHYDRYWEWPFERRLWDIGFWFQPYIDEYVLHTVPGFTLRPTLYHIKKLKKIQISNSNQNFELNTGLDMKENYKMYLTNKKKFIHLANSESESAYFINGDIR